MKQQIHLLYVIHSLNNGGAETLAIRLAENLDSDHFAATVCSLSDEGPLREVLVAKNVPFVTLGKREGKDLATIPRLARLIRDKRIDIVHSHNQGPLLYTVLATLFNRRCKVVHTEHINMLKEFSYSRKDRLYNIFMFKRLAGFISIAHHLTDDFCSQYDLSRALVTTIHNSVAIPVATASPSRSVRDELGIAGDALLIGNISALRQQKDHATLVRAMEIVVRIYPEAVLVIAGDGELAEELKALVASLGLDRNVQFLGYRSDVDQLLGQLDLFVLSSLYEGLPLCILEAMAVGCPVVATDADGTNELVRDRETGLLVPLRDPEALAEAILQLLAAPDVAAKMGKAARKLIVDQYNMRTMISHYEGFYRRLLF